MKDVEKDVDLRLERALAKTAQSLVYPAVTTLDDDLDFDVFCVEIQPFGEVRYENEQERVHYVRIAPVAVPERARVFGRA